MLCFVVTYLSKSVRSSPIRTGVLCFLQQLIRELEHWGSAEAGEQPTAGEKPQILQRCPAHCVTHYSKPPAQSVNDDNNGEIQYAHDSSNGIRRHAPKANTHVVLSFGGIHLRILPKWFQFFWVILGFPLYMPKSCWYVFSGVSLWRSLAG